jgi:hypothetical protein
MTYRLPDLQDPENKGDVFQDLQNAGVMAALEQDPRQAGCFLAFRMTVASKISRGEKFADLGPKVFLLKGLGLDFGVDLGAKVSVLKGLICKILLLKGLRGGRSKANTEILAAPE